jgi:hypothetical protein
MLGRNVVSGRRYTFTGYVPSSKEGNDFRQIAYESLLERDFIQILEDDEDVASYQDRSEAVVWTDTEGCKRRYLPDFDILMKNGKRVCVEVKPFGRIVRKGLVPHYERIGRHAVEGGRFDHFEIWTEFEIRGRDALYNAELRNVGRLNRGGSALSPSLSVAGAMRTSGGRSTLGDLRRLSGLPNDSFWAVIGSLAGREIHLEDPLRAIDDDSVVVDEVCK